MKLTIILSVFAIWIILTYFFAYQIMSEVGKLGISQILKIIFIVFVWGMYTIFSFSLANKIRKMSEIDNSMILRVLWENIKDSTIPKSLRIIEESVQEKSELSASFTPIQGFILPLRKGDKISEDFVRDRRQYILNFSNSGNQLFTDIRLRLQFPYPLENYDITTIEKVMNAQFSPVQPYAVNIINGGSIEINRTPITRSYQFQADKIEPGGKYEIRLILNSWRDPRGKTIPPGEGARYFVPQTGPKLTYIYGTYQLQIETVSKDKSFYVPFILKEDKTVILGVPSTPPDSLMEITSFE